MHEKDSFVRNCIPTAAEFQWKVPVLVFMLDRNLDIHSIKSGHEYVYIEGISFVVGDEMWKYLPL